MEAAFPPRPPGNAAAFPPEILTLFFSFGCYFPEERRRDERSTLPLFSGFSGDLDLLEGRWRRRRRRRRCLAHDKAARLIPVGCRGQQDQRNGDGGGGGVRVVVGGGRPEQEGESVIHKTLPHGAAAQVVKPTAGFYGGGGGAPPRVAT